MAVPAATSHPAANPPIAAARVDTSEPVAITPPSPATSVLRARSRADVCPTGSRSHVRSHPHRRQAIPRQPRTMVLKVEKLEAEPGSTITFTDVLAVGGEGTLTIGSPVVAARLSAPTVIAQDRSGEDHHFQEAPPAEQPPPQRPPSARHGAAGRPRSTQPEPGSTRDGTQESRRLVPQRPPIPRAAASA